MNSTITIQKRGITSISADCIVNAANSRLQEGGGVCGVIFKAAGRAELQAACQKIGYCDEGSAVITPAFNAKAKYIIHAVGPYWYGGSNGEAKKLYSCYQTAMHLAQENECHSIVFPVISAGIFRYPKDEAWEVAIQSVLDYQKAHDNYKLDAIFAVIDAGMKSMGESIFAKLVNTDIIKFHKIHEENGYLSNWYLCDFVIDGTKYCCVEQYMMEQKARLFQDFETADRIMKTQDQAEMQLLGRNAKNYNKRLWDGNKQLIVYTGIMAKFEQNPALKAQLLSTGTATLVECSRSDSTWGIGMGMHDSIPANPSMWNGDNLLGFALMAARAELKRRRF